MGKKLKITLTILGLAFVLWCSFFTTDKIRIKNDKSPIFVIKVANYDDGGSEKFMGFFYSVYHIKNMEQVNEEVKRVDYGFYMSSWFSSLDEVKKDIIK